MKYTLAGCLLFAALPVQAQVLDCASLSTSAGTEPSGFAEACLGHATKAATGPRLAGLAGEALPGYGVQINPTQGFVAQGLYQFGLDNFAGATRLGTTTETVNMFGLDFNPAGTRLYGAQFLSSLTGSRLGTFNLTTGAFLTQGFLGSLPPNDSVTGLAFDPRTGTAWLSTYDLLTNNPQLGEARLWRLDTTSLSTGIVGRLLPNELNPVFTDIAVNCDGEMYGHNLTDDSIYRINPTNGEATLVGPHGLAANFAQGMDFDSATGTLYGSIYTGGGANTFGTFDLETGAFNALETGPVGQWKFAIRNECSPKTIEPETIEGAWYAPYSSGQGFTARYYADTGVLFMPWFTYSLEGGEETSEQRWYSLFGEVGDDVTEVELPILQTLGGNFDAPPGVGATQVGVARLRFYSCSEGVLEYQFDEGHNGGAQGRITMTRLLPRGTPCTQFNGDVVDALVEYDPLITGSWYDPETSGQGLELFNVIPIEADPDEDIEARAGLFYGGWFTFEPSPAEAGPEGQRWFTFSGQQIDEEEGTLRTTIVQATGGSFDNAPSLETSRAGIAVFESEACDRLKLTYTFDDFEAVGEFRDKEGEIILRRLGGCPPAN